MITDKGNQSDRQRLRHQQVIEAYDIVLNRWPDEDGLSHYLSLMSDGKMTHYDVIIDLYRSEECANRTARSKLDDLSVRLAVLAPLFDVALSGKLLGSYVDSAGMAKIGLASRLALEMDMGSLVAGYLSSMVGGKIR